MTRIARVFAIVGIVLGIMAPTQMAFADGEDSLPPIPVLTGQWWQWAYSLPTSQNPLTDVTGERCMFGQRGPIWFLLGNEGKNAPPRTCSVPEGAILFFPVINAVNFNTPGKCGNTSQDLNTLTLLRQSVAQFIDPVPVQDLFASVDGHSIKNLIQRVKSEPFAVALPKKPDNLCGDVDAGIYAPAVDDGYYVLLEPLERGKHTVKFGSTATSFPQNNTYNLTIEKVSLK
jgi:hypothetical protein